jgi:hypothetical protein
MYILEGMHADGCASLQESRSQEDQERQEAKFQQRGYGQVLAELFRRTAGPYQRDYYPSGNYEGLQGIKDSRGRADMTARRKSWAWV